MNRPLAKSLLLSVVFACSAVTVSSVHAQLAQNLLIGNAKAIALGNAVTADPPGIDSIHFNPAGLAKIKDRQIHLKFIAGNADIRGEFTSNEDYDQLLEDNQMEGQDSMANSESTIEAFAVYLPGSGVTELPVIAAPVGGMSTQLTENLTFGTAAYAPLILGYTRADDDPGRFYGKEVGMSRITYLSPTIGWQINESLSIGAGIGISYFGVGIDLDYRAANQLLGSIKSITDSACQGVDNGIVFEGVPINLCGGELSPFESLFTLQVDVTEAFSPTFNLGILWEPTEWFSLGFVYQSEAADRLEGDVNVLLSDSAVGFAQGLADSNPFLNFVVDVLEITDNNGQIQSGGHIDLKMPAHASIGTSIRITPSLKFNVDYKWTQTSVWDEFAFIIDDGIPFLGLLGAIGISGVGANEIIIPRGYEDATNFAYGIEYQWDDRMAFRFGYEPRDSGIPDDKLDFLIPLGDFDLYGIGLSYRMDKDTVVDASFAYAKSDQYIPTGSSTNGNNLTLDNFVYNPSAGLDVRSVIEIMVFEFSYQSTF